MGELNISEFVGAPYTPVPDRARFLITAVFSLGSDSIGEIVGALAYVIASKAIRRCSASQRMRKPDAFAISAQGPLWPSIMWSMRHFEMMTMLLWH